MNEPRFAVVGHPNKGKSSIVATLAEDDTVQISPTPGTTTRVRAFPMTVEGEVLYTLIDTPGFQRARKALAWLQAHTTSASQRAQTVHDFLVAHEDSDLFHDEVEILTPLMEGAGILYVIDGTQRYGREYEAEMEILRYTGQPSMALINMIGETDYSGEWIAALNQYFKIVRKFNPYTAEFQRRLEVLKAFGQLKEEWREPLERAARELTRERESRRHRSARIIAGVLYDTLTYRIEQTLTNHASQSATESAGLDKLTNAIRRFEHVAWEQVESIFGYHQLQANSEALALLGEDLFSKRSHQVWGLTPTQVVATAAIGGAAIGTGVDLALGGASLFGGAAIGALIGGASGFFSHQRLAEVKVMGVTMGQEILQIGPVTNLNIPYVLLARGIFHYRQIADRTHARRDALDLRAAAEHTGAQHLPSNVRKSLEREFSAIRSRASEMRRSTAIEQLGAIIEPLLADEPEHDTEQ